MTWADANEKSEASVEEDVSRCKKSLGRNKRMWPNVHKRLELQPSYCPIKNDHEAGGSKSVPWWRSKIEQPGPIELRKKVTRKALEKKIAYL